MIFGFGKKNSEVIDLAERYRRQKAREVKTEAQSNSTTDSNISESPSSPFAFFDTSHETEQEEFIDVSDSIEKRKRLAKRILDMTNKIEDLSNQIYHLQQRIEVLEKRTGVNKFDIIE